MNRIMYIGGETGIGKSTQIGQFILESCLSMNQKCRVIISEPFDLVAFHLAHKVAEERGELIGDLIGYQISTENK